MINNYKILNEVIVNWNNPENTQDDGIISTDSVSESMFKVPRCITYPWLNWPIDGDIIDYIKGYNNYKVAEWIMKTYNIESLFRKIDNQLNKIKEDGYCNDLSNWFSDGNRDDHCELNKNAFRGMEYLIKHVLWDIDHWTNREIKPEHQKIVRQYIILAKFLNELFSDSEIEKICKKEINNIPEEDIKRHKAKMMHINFQDYIPQKEPCLELVLYDSLFVNKEIFKEKIENICNKWNINLKREPIEWGIGDYASVSFYINIPPEFFK